jgi:glycogen operon protein
MDDDLHIMVNAHWEELPFELPPRPEHSPWRRAVDTSLPTPHDIAEPGDEPVVAGPTYHVQARSVAILIAREEASADGDAPE